MKNAINCFFIICLLALLHAACAPNQEPGCGEKKIRDSVALVYPDTFSVYFQLDEKSVDVTQSFPLEHWEVDAVKVYIKGPDTFDLAWTRSHGLFNISKGMDYMKNKALQDSIFGVQCKYSIYQVKMNELTGAIGDYTYLNYKELRFLGESDKSGYVLRARWKTNLQNEKVKDDFTCLLNSITFTKVP